MPTYNIDTAATAAKLERSGFTAEQARGIATIVAEADSGHVTKADLRVLEQQLQTGFAKLETAIADANNRTQIRTIGACLAGIAVATAIRVAALA